MDERVWPSVTLVLREVEPDPSTCDRDERGKARLELMLPLLDEPEALIPADSPTGILDIEHRHDFFVQRVEVRASRTRGAEARLRQCGSDP